MYHVFDVDREDRATTFVCIILSTTDSKVLLNDNVDSHQRFNHHQQFIVTTDHDIPLAWHVLFEYNLPFVAASVHVTTYNII